MEAPEGFAVPSFAGPLDVEGAIDACPSSATVKGLFVDGIQRKIRKLGDTPVYDVRTVPFRDYPARRQMELLAQWARLAHRGTPIREGLRRIGHAAYPDLAKSLAGRVIFGALGSDLAAITRLVSKGYEISGAPQRATLVDHGPRHARVRLDEVYIFLDTYQIGVLEGALIACRAQGTVSMRPISVASCEMFVAWT